VPTVKLPACALLMVRCGAVTVVRSDELLSMPVGFPSPVSETVAVLVTDGDAAVPTVTTSGKLGFAPMAMGPAFVQVTGRPATQFQPPPPLPAATKVRPAGSVSLTMIALVVASVPLLVTWIVYVPLVPTVKLPA